MAGPAEKTCPKTTTLQTSQQPMKPSIKEKFAQLYLIQLIIFSLKSLNPSYMGKEADKRCGKAGSRIDKVSTTIWRGHRVSYLFKVVLEELGETILLAAKMAMPNHSHLDFISPT